MKQRFVSESETPECSQNETTGKQHEEPGHATPGPWTSYLAVFSQDRPCKEQHSSYQAGGASSKRTEQKASGVHISGASPGDALAWAAHVLLPASS